MRCWYSWLRIYAAAEALDLVTGGVEGLVAGSLQDSFEAIRGRKPPDVLHVVPGIPLEPGFARRPQDIRARPVHAHRSGQIIKAALRSAAKDLGVTLSDEDVD